MSAGLTRTSACAASSTALMVSHVGAGPGASAMPASTRAAPSTALTAPHAGAGLGAPRRCGRARVRCLRRRSQRLAPEQVRAGLGDADEVGGAGAAERAVV